MSGEMVELPVTCAEDAAEMVAPVFRLKQWSWALPRPGYIPTRRQLEDTYRSLEVDLGWLELEGRYGWSISTGRLSVRRGDDGRTMFLVERPE